MFGGLEDLAAIGAFAFEDTAGIVEAMAQHMEVGLVPWHELAVVPDDPFKPVIGLGSHCILLHRTWQTRSAAVMAHFLRLFQYFASPGNTRHELTDRYGQRPAHQQEPRTARFRTILSSIAVFL